MERYKIGGFCLSWEGEGFQLQPGRFFEQFRWEEGEPGPEEQIRFCGCVKDMKLLGQYKSIRKENAYELYEVEGEKILAYQWQSCRYAFGFSVDRIEGFGMNRFWIAPEMAKGAQMTVERFFSISGLHRALLQREAPVLHASYVDYEGKALLFAAPSGTGKSTQADLWKTYAGAEVINGDRVLLRKRKGAWYAYGYPCCGSSKICKNRTLPVQAIVLLAQGERSEIEHPSQADKVGSLAAGMEIYKWDSWEIAQSLQLAEKLAEEIPVFRLTCTPDREAVRVVKTYLEAGR